MVASSIAMPEALMQTIGRIADAERRSKNRQMVLFLERQVAEWERMNGTALPLAINYGKKAPPGENDE